MLLTLKTPADAKDGVEGLTGAVESLAEGAGVVWVSIRHDGSVGHSRDHTTILRVEKKVGLDRLLLLLLRNSDGMVDSAEASDVEEEKTRVCWLMLLLFNGERRYRRRVGAGAKWNRCGGGSGKKRR